MNTQARKNIRQAFPSIAFGSPEWEASQAATDWVAESGSNCSTFLAQLDLLTIARRCLIDGDTLEEAGEAGPYGSTAQRRAWAAGKLASACRAIAMAKQLDDERKAAAARMAHLEKKVELLRAETRAAARFHTIKVPFREKQPVSVDWEG